MAILKFIEDQAKLLYERMKTGELNLSEIGILELPTNAQDYEGFTDEDVLELNKFGMDVTAQKVEYLKKLAGLEKQSMDHINTQMVFNSLFTSSELGDICARDLRLLEKAVSYEPSDEDAKIVTSAAEHLSK